MGNLDPCYENHVWVFDERGYSHCEKCGCTRTKGQCPICQTEFMTGVGYISKKGIPFKFCSDVCLMQYLKKGEK